MTLSTAADDRREGRRWSTQSPPGGAGTRDHVSALAAVVEDLAGQFDLRPLLERILGHAADLLDCDSGSICTVDQSAGTYRKEVDLGVACRSGARFPLTEGVTGEILRAGGPVTFTEYADVRGGHIAPAERAQLHATIGVPIRWSGSVIGTCIVFSRDRRRRFGPDDVTLLELFAGHAGLAMVNVRLHAQAAALTRAEAAGLERERVVRDVHDSVARALASVIPHLDSAELPTGPPTVGAARFDTRLIDEHRIDAPPVETRPVDTPPLDGRGPGPGRLPDGNHPTGAPDAVAPAAGPLDLARRAAWDALRETGRPLPPRRTGTVPAGAEPSASGGSDPAADLETGLRTEVDAAKTAGLDIRLVVAGPRRRLPGAVIRALLALGRQAIGTIVANADARTARVGLVFGPAEVVLFVQDDGVGFDIDERPRPDGSGLGLRGPGGDRLTGIGAGTERVGGTVQIDATPGWGTTVRAAIPYPAPFTDHDAVTDVTAESGYGPASGARRIRVLVVEHRPLVTAGVLSVLQEDDELFHAVGQTAGVADTLAAVGLLLPDVVLIDAALPAGAADLTAKVRDRAGRVPVLAVGERDPAEPAVLDMLRRGADGVVLVDADGADFRAAVKAATQVPNRLPGTRPPSGVPIGRPAQALTPQALTPREREVRALVSRGLPDKGIAAALNISVKTVEKHVGAALRKTGARNRTELAALSRS